MLVLVLVLVVVLVVVGQARKRKWCSVREGVADARVTAYPGVPPTMYV